MAMLNGVKHEGNGWSVPAELWPAAVTRGNRRWGTTAEGDSDDRTGDAGSDCDRTGGGRDDGEDEP